MNPNSAYYLSFNTGYPNAFDREHGRTGSELMVHGTCSSRGCYAMTDDGIAEVYALARESFAGGQKAFQFQAYPFRMTAENMAKFRKDPNMPFWANLKQGADHFEVTKQEPKVAVCGGRYAFDTVGGTCKSDPSIEAVVAEKESTDRQAVAELVAKGTPAVKVVYADGGGHESFREASLALASGTEVPYSAFGGPSPRLGDVSRPDALAAGPREIALEDGPAAATVAAVSRRGAPVTKVAAAHDVKAPAAPAAKPQRTVLASADPDEPIAMAPPPAPEKPFYDRIGGIFSNGGTREAAAQAPAIAPSAPEPAKSAAAKPAVAHKPAAPAKKAEAKPLAHSVSGEKPIGDKRAHNGGLIPGSAPIGAVASAFKMN